MRKPRMPLSTHGNATVLLFNLLAAQSGGTSAQRSPHRCRLYARVSCGLLLHILASIVTCRSNRMAGGALTVYRCFIIDVWCFLLGFCDQRICLLLLGLHIWDRAFDILILHNIKSQVCC